MTVPSVETGRGAFTKIGKDNGSKYYEYIVGKSPDGSSPDKDVNYQAVNLGVKAIQARLNAYEYSPALVVDGILGSKSTAAIKWLQTKLGVTADGQLGPITCRAMWKDLLIWFGGIYHVPASQMYGFMMLESVGDPGAVGYTTPSDRGLNQINLKAHPDVTVEQAFDPLFSIDYTAKRLQGARIKYSGKTSELKNYCAIAQHNSPLQANQWYATGQPPTEQIKKYVDLVLTHAMNFK